MDEYRRFEEIFARIERILCILNGEAVEEPEPEERLATAARDESSRQFLDAHPELREPDPLQFTDDEVLAALEEAIRQDEAYAAAPKLSWHTACQPRGAVWSGDVADVLAGRREQYSVGEPRATTRDTLRVAAALRRLERAGRVTAFRHRNRTYTPYWTITGREAHVREDIRAGGDPPDLVVTDTEILKAVGRRVESTYDDVITSLLGGRQRTRSACGVLNYRLTRLAKEGLVEYVLAGPKHRTRLWRLTTAGQKVARTHA